MRHVAAEDLRLPSPTLEDLAEAARAKRDGGAPRLLRRRLLRALASRLFHRRPDALRFVREAEGALRLEGVDARVSAAGCDGWSVVALGPGAIGVDIEADEGGSSHLARWTLVEAYLKALGTGLTVAPETVGLQAAGCAPPRAASGVASAVFDLSVAGARYPPGRGWLHTPAPGVIAAVAVLRAERLPPPSACRP